MSDNKLDSELKEIIEDYLNEFVYSPTFETCEKDISAQQKIVYCLMLLTKTIDLIQKKGVCIDVEYIEQLPEEKKKKRIKLLEKTKKKLEKGELPEEGLEILKDSHIRKELLPFLEREFNSIVVSVLSASYISAFILMRSVLELLVEIATSQRGTRTEKSIEGISFLFSPEQADIKIFWKHLSKWSHPYTGKWVNDFCPTYMSREPRYHVKFCTQAVGDMMKLVDLLLVISLEKFKISKKDFLKEETEREIFDCLELVLYQNRT